VGKAAFNPDLPPGDSPRIAESVLAPAPLLELLSTRLEFGPGAAPASDQSSATLLARLAAAPQR